MPLRPARSGTIALLAAVLALALGGCGGSGTSGATESASVTATPAAEVTGTPSDAVVIPMRITADSVDPAGTKVQASLDQPVVLKISAERAGELHVHSSPEQHVEFPAGESEVTLSFTRPGIVEIEDHDLEALIVQVEVR